MSNVWDAIASFFEWVANIGAGAASAGLGYEPKVPQELQK